MISETVDKNISKKVEGYFRIRDLDQFHDQYDQVYTLIPEYIFESFQKKCLVIYDLNMA